jgi:chorismate dehydratase
VQTPRISASSYSNTAPLIWSFLYGSQHGRVELILDNAPARSAELLSQGRVDAALVPVIAYHTIEDVRLIPGVCVGAREKVRSVCLVTEGKDLGDVRSVALDVSSRTSVVLTKILFREFIGFEPEWRPAEPDLEKMLAVCDAALLIGDPALAISDPGFRNSDFQPKSHIPNPKSQIQKFDLAELWRTYTGLGFVFAMWMTRAERSPVDFAAARDEGLERIDEIVSNYLPDTKIGADEFRRYLTENISYSIGEDLQSGMELYFELARKHRLCDGIRELKYTP